MNLGKYSADITHGSTSTAPHRKSVRLKGYDYTSEGFYFVTICTKDRNCYFGEVIAGEMQLSEMGLVAYQGWKAESTLIKILGSVKVAILFFLLTLSASVLPQTNEPIVMIIIVGHDLLQVKGGHRLHRFWYS
ncbi:MAG: hypothetical protein ACE5H0_06185 [Bacteroidota bacterium]